jgi:hypothetical protein
VPRSEGATQRRKRIFENASMGHGPDRPAEWSGGLRGRDGLAQRTGPVGPDPRKNSNGKNDFSISIEFGFRERL